MARDGRQLPHRTCAERAAAVTLLADTDGKVTNPAARDTLAAVIDAAQDPAAWWDGKHALADLRTATEAVRISHQAWVVEQNAARARIAAAATSGAGRISGAATGGDHRGIAAETLASLPGSGGVRLLWDRPDVGSHLGGVYLDVPTEILLNEQRLSRNPGRVADVVKHEMAHIYQGRIGAQVGYETLVARMNELFGSGGLEKAADCVARRFGASWTHCKPDCSGQTRQDAVTALINGHLP